MVASGGAGNHAQSGAVSTPSTSTSGAGAPKAMTWAEKLASKASASSNSTANSIPTMSVPSSTPSRPAQSTNSASTRTATRPHAAGKGADGTTTTPAQKQRTHTSADSGWGEGDSSHDGQASAEASTSQSSVPKPSIASKAAEATIAEVSEPLGIPEAEPTPPAAVKQPSGPPKVNIWKVRQEENAKKAAEQAKLLAEQEAIRAAQAPLEDSSKQATVVSNKPGETTGAATGKKTKGQKKRENAALAASNGSNATQSPTGGAIPKSSQNATSGKTLVPASNPQPAAQPTVAAPSATAVPNPDDAQAWPSPLEDKAKEDAELARKSTAEREERERQREESTSRSVSSVAGSPTAEKKKPTWKTLQPEITFNAPIPSRQGQPMPRTGSRSPTVTRSANGSTSGTSTKRPQNGSGKSKNSSAAASPVEEKSAPTMQKTTSNQSSRRPSKAIEKPVAHQKVEAQTAPSPALPETTDGKSTLRPEAEAHQPFMPRPAQPARNPSSSAPPANAGLPAKPTGSRNTPSLSSMQQPRPPLTPKDSQPSTSSHASTSGPSPAVTPSLSTVSTNTETGPSTAPSTQSEPIAGLSNNTDASEQVASPQRSYQNQSQSQFSGPKKPRGGSSATRGTRGGISGTGRGGYAGNASNRSNGQAANASQHTSYTNGQHQSNFHHNNSAYQGQFFFDPATAQPIPYYAPPTYPQYPAFPGQQQFYNQHQSYSNTSSPPSQQQMLPFTPNGSAFNPYAPPPMPYQPYPQENAQFQQQMYERPAPLYDYSFYPFPNDGGTAFFVLGQIEFYFSKDNLARDSWVRQNMDAEGWIEIAVIAAFKRLASLTSDVNLVKEMMRLSCMVEIRENKVRTVDWQHWILPTAKPASWQDPKSSIEPSYQPPQQMMGIQHMQQPYDQQLQMQYFAGPQQAPYQPYQASAGQSAPSVQSNKEENATGEPVKDIAGSSETAARTSATTAEASTA